MSRAPEPARKALQASDSVNTETALDFSQRPLVAIWEVTRACDLSCVHCRACAQPLRDLRELTFVEGRRLIDDVAELKAPIFVLTGGDPLKRRDIYDLVSHARQAGLRPALTPSATALLTRPAMEHLKDCGLARLAVSLDGATPEVHDGFRGMRGSWARTLEAVQWAREIRLPVQINTTVTRRNVHQLALLAELLGRSAIVLWSVFFLVPTGRGQISDLLDAEQAEEAFEVLYHLSLQTPFHIKTTEAPHYRRFLLQRQSASGKNAGFARGAVNGMGTGVGDGKGFVFVSHIGEVFPSGFLPVAAGSIRQQPLAEIYRHSALFRALRDADLLKGKCGRCEFRHVCGGSRARAYAVTHDIFAPDPCCAYRPAAEGVV